MDRMAIVVMVGVALATQGCESAGGGRSSRDAATGDLGQDVGGACALPAAQVPGAVCDDEAGVVWMSGGADCDAQGPMPSSPMVLPDRCEPFFCVRLDGAVTGACAADGTECTPSCLHDSDCAPGYTCDVY